MSGLSGLSNHCRERSFLIWAVVGFFALAIGVSSGDQWTRCVAWAKWLATCGLGRAYGSQPVGIQASRARQRMRNERGTPAHGRGFLAGLGLAPSAHI